MTFALGDYRAIELIGSGGSAQVWRGVRVSNGAPIAIKVFPPDQLAAARREAALAAVVNHPHVITVVDVVGDAERAALVTEFAAGGDLGHLLASRGRLSPGETLTVLLPLAAALATAHERQIVHGDVSAANVLFDLAGRPLLADLGAGRAAAEMGMPVSTTAVDAAPELARGGPATPASDMFSLGSLALACLTGRHAWPADDLRDVVIQAAAGQWPDPGESGPIGLITAVRALLEHDPDHRPGAASLVLDLRACGRPEAIDLRREIRDRGPAVVDEPPVRPGVVPMAGRILDRHPDPATGGRGRTGRHEWAAAERSSGSGPGSGPTPGSSGVRRPGRAAARPGPDDQGVGLRARAVTRARADAVPMDVPAPSRTRRRLRLQRDSAPGRVLRVGVIVLTCVLVAGLAATAGLLWAGWDRSNPATRAQDASPPVSAVRSPARSAADSPPPTTVRRSVPTTTTVPTSRLPTSVTTPPGDRRTSPTQARPSVVTPVTSAGLSGGAAVAGASANWVSTVRELDAARAKALVDRDARLLDAVYTTASPARTADGVMIARLLSGGLRVSGAGHLVRQARALAGASIRLIVDDSLPSYSILDAKGVVVGRTAARANAMRVFVLVRTPAGYRISQVQSA